MSMSLRNCVTVTILSMGVLFGAQAARAQPPAATPAQTSSPVSTEQSLKGVQIKGKAPVNQAPLAPRLPKPQTAVLDNGLQIVLIEHHKLPTFTLQLALRQGGVSDPKGKEGLAEATAGVLREGTRTRTAEQISERIDALGGALFASADLEDSSVTTLGLVENFDAILELFVDVIRNPIFPQSELDKYKQRLLSQIQSQRASSSFTAQEQFVRSVYGDFPAGTLVPPEESIKGLTTADLAAFHATNYVPDIATLLVAGDVTLPQLRSKLQRALGDWPKKQTSAAKFAEVSVPASARVIVVDRPGAVQTSLIIGSLGIKGDDPDRFALSVMNQILGGGAASRLFTNLREDKGYTYGAYSGVSIAQYAGTVRAYAEVRTEVTEGAMQEFMAELTRIGKEPVSAVELANAKRAIIGRFALSLENPQSFLGNVYQQRTYNFPADYWDKYPERISAITSADVMRVAAKYFAPQRLQFIAVGDEPKIRPVMEKYGKRG